MSRNELDQIMNNKTLKKEFENDCKFFKSYYEKNEVIDAYTIDRAVITLIKKEPYLKWANSISDPDLVSTLEDLNSDPSTYLIPSGESNVELLAHLCVLSKEIFEIELNGWSTDEKEWEKDKSWENFNKWFDYTISSMPIDLGRDEIERADF
jgi:hypothetical protein